MYTILWLCCNGDYVFYDETIYQSVEEVKAKFDELNHNPKYAGEVFKIAKVVPI